MKNLEKFKKKFEKFMKIYSENFRKFKKLYSKKVIKSLKFVIGVLKKFKSFW